jgi:RimJ/RimL family protein N-acetyltransferase
MKVSGGAPTMTLTLEPKTITLKNGTEVTIRPMELSDRELLMDFFRRLPMDDRRYLRYDVTNPQFMETWATEVERRTVLRLLAFSGGQVIGKATLRQNAHSWTSHVAWMRLVTDPAFRQQGLGLNLAIEAFEYAVQRQVEKVVGEMAVGQEPARRIFEKLGFECEAVLKNHIKDLMGQKHDMMIFSHDLSESWLKLRDAILDKVRI